MPCSTGACANASIPMYRCRPPNCCCRSARRATSPWRIRAPRKWAPPRASRIRRCREVRRIRSPHDSAPQTHLLSNGRYSVMVTAAGSGYSRWNDLAITRWREDVTRDDTGSYLLHARRGNRPRVVGGLPALRRAARQLRSELHRGPRRDHSRRRRHRQHARGAGLARGRRRSAPAVADATVRCARAKSRSLRMPSWCSAPRPRTSRIRRSRRCSCAPNSSRARALLLANRRRRAPDEPEIWASHHAVVEGVTVGAPQHETDRAKFLGRGRELRAPLAMLEGRALSGTVGTVLDAVFALRYRLRIPAGGTARIAYWTCVARRPRAAARTRRQASRRECAHARRHAGVDPGTGTAASLRHRRLAGHRVPATRRPHPVRRAPRRARRPTRSGAARPGPPRCGRSPSPAICPSCCCGSRKWTTSRSVRQLLQAHEYWGIKRLAVDLVILNERGASYVQDLQVAIEAAVRTSLARPRIAGADTRGKVFVLRTDLITAGNARAAVRRGTRRVVGPARQPRRPGGAHAAGAGGRAAPSATRAAASAPAPRIRMTRASWNSSTASAASPRRAANIASRCPTGRTRRLPWINVVANRGFRLPGGQRRRRLHLVAQQPRERADALVERSGHRPARRDYLPARRGNRRAVDARRPRRSASKTRSTPARTAWATAASSSCRMASRSSSRCSCRSTIRSRSAGSRCATSRRAAAVSRSPRMSNGCSGRRARAGAPHVITEHDADTGAMFARNPWNTAFPGVAFADLRGAQTEFTCDRREFLGRHGTLDAPAALVSGAPLSGRAGAALDPCAALRTPSRARTLGDHRDRLPARRGGGQRRSARADCHLSRRRRREAARRRCARTGRI